MVATTVSHLRIHAGNLVFHVKYNCPIVQLTGYLAKEIFDPKSVPGILPLDIFHPSDWPKLLAFQFGLIGTQILPMATTPLPRHIPSSTKVFPRNEGDNLCISSNSPLNFLKPTESELSGVNHNVMNSIYSSFSPPKFDKKDMSCSAPSSSAPSSSSTSSSSSSSCSSKTSGAMPDPQAQLWVKSQLLSSLIHVRHKDRHVVPCILSSRIDFISNELMYVLPIITMSLTPLPEESHSFCGQPI